MVSTNVTTWSAPHGQHMVSTSPQTLSPFQLVLDTDTLKPHGWKSGEGSYVNGAGAMCFVV